MVKAAHVAAQICLSPDIRAPTRRVQGTAAADTMRKPGSRNLSVRNGEKR
jgi:hypothetical protein